MLSVRTKITFLGHVGPKGIESYPNKVRAIRNFACPEDRNGIRRFLGMVSQMEKFIPHLTEVTMHIRQLLDKGSAWIWGQKEKDVLEQFKQLCSTPLLAPYDYSREAKVPCDSSSYRIGAVLLQKHDADWRPVYFASHSLSETEQRYSQIEREALAVAC